jgi:hypothetical protein
VYASSLFIASILPLVAGKGVAKQNSLAAALRKVIPRLCQMRFFIQKFHRDCNILNAFQAILKNEGLNQATYKKLIEQLEKFPKNSILRKHLLVWLHKHIKIQCSLGGE